MSGKRKSSGWIKKTRIRVAERDGNACSQCGEPNRVYAVGNGVYVTSHDEGHRYTKVIWRSLLELEHSTPLHLGGTNDDDNLRLLCKPCHQSKTSAEQSARLKALGAGRNA